jgi:hypothetical protein
MGPQIANPQIANQQIAKMLGPQIASFAEDPQI